jgi:hypothetical protein
MGLHGHGSIKAFRTELGPEKVVLRGLLPVTSPEWTAVHLSEYLPLRAAVISLDCAFRSKQVTPDTVSLAFAGRHGPGIVRAREALALSDPLSGSIAESEARFLFHEAGLPPAVTQYRVGLGALTAFLDFAWPEAMVLVEIDGREFHIEREPFQRDRTKQNALIRAGWTVLRFTVEDIRLRSTSVVEEIRHALGR